MYFVHLSKWVGGSATHINPPLPGLVPGGNGVVNAPSVVLYFLTLVPQVQYVTLVMDLGAPALPPTLPHSYLALAVFFFRRLLFGLVFDLVFVPFWGHV